MFSLAATGNLGNALTYYSRLEQSICRHKRDLFPFPTLALLEIQDFMRHTVWTWQHLTQNIKDEWDVWAHTYRPDGSGYNFFTCYYMRDLAAGLIPDLEPL